MQKFILSFFLAALLLFCFSQKPVFNYRGSLLAAYNNADKIFIQADKLRIQSETNDAVTPLADEKNRTALTMFLRLIPEAEKSGNDSLAFYIQLKSAIIYHYFDSLPKAKQLYSRALQHRSKAGLRDSLFFQPALFIGSIFYTESNLDSAMWYLKYAEEINDKFGGHLSESQRLYNISGAINFQTGNYSQAVKYFEKAVSVILNKSPDEKSLLVNYKINIGISLLKLEQYGDARKIYEELLKENAYSNEINQNLGFISLKENKFNEAIQYFRKVNYINDKKLVDLNLNLATAFDGLDKKDSSDLYLLKAKEENLRWYGHQKNISNGLILKFQGDQLTRAKQYPEAINFYHQALIQFNPAFNDTAAEKNPEIFSSTFSYINLFNTLAAKGDAFEQLYHEQKEISQLKNSLGAYKSAFTLADHVEKTYNSDEARLFLGKIKHNVHSRPIEISLELYDLTKQNKYLEDAFRFDQQNKASVLSLNVQENELRNTDRLNNDLYVQETSLKTTITRLSLKITQTTDSFQLFTLNASIRDNEIQLARVQEKINNDPAYRSRYFASNIPSINDLQKKLDNKTALISWHLSEGSVIAFLVTGNQFDYFRIPAGNDFYNAADSFKKTLQNTSVEQRYTGSAIAEWLYKKLISPVYDKIANAERLIIIPDDELNYLPFEALQDEEGHYLIEKYAISYQYSTALLDNNDKMRKAEGIIAFAPFASKKFSDASQTKFSSLPASAEEISNLKGKIFIDNAATKNNFLTEASHYGTIHLATHASVNNEMPMQSYIAFYPGESDYKLYSQEIYNLRLDSTRLIILSACETGTGQLVKGEGLMSLSRAFAYAGCPNIITSLWKAEDNTTAFLTKKLHYYLDRGFTKDKALQQSKLDLLKSNEIDPRFKTPNYWSHLIFIGNYEPEHRSTGWWWIAFSIIAASLLYIFMRNKRKA